MPGIDLLLLSVLASQVLVGSVLLPARLLALTRRIVDTYPPSSHGKLYPRGVDGAERSRLRYALASAVVLLAGVALVVHGFVTRHDELLGWDTQSVLTLLLVLQWLPMLVVAGSPGFPYFNLERRQDARRTRTARLARRGMLDLVPRWTVGLAVACYLAFVAVVLAAPERWGAGYWNLAAVTGMNVFLFTMARIQVHGRKKDPYQSEDDRVRALARGVRTAFWVSILATVYLMIHVSLKPLGGSVADAAASLYFQILFLYTIAQFRIDDVDFDVYRERSAPARARRGGESLDPVAP